MKFSRVIGNISAKLLADAETKLSKVFLELAVRYDNHHLGSSIGGDPLIFSLVYPVDHVATLNIPTAATDGKRYYWNPKFVSRLDMIGLRIVCAHEAWHAIYMHPARRGSRHPKLWNIAVDYVVNSTIMEDLQNRKLDAVKLFTQHLGRFMTLSNFMELIKDPLAKIPGFEDLNPYEDSNSGVDLPHANLDRELSEEEKKELERRESMKKFFFADPELTADLRRPENIYDMLYKLLPKCSTCGRIGRYTFPNSKKNQGKEGQDPSHDDSENHNHKQDKSSKGCPECDDGVDVFDLGGTLDDHMDSEESEEKMARRVSDAMETAKKMAGYVPASLEDELGELTSAKINWSDIIRSHILRTRAGNDKNDWTRFKSRPMFAGLFLPKRKTSTVRFGVLLDTSGSMSKDDMAYGVSQLQSLDERGECTITYADAQIYWKDSIKIRKCNVEELKKIKPKGRGGTMFADYFSDYEKNIGKCNFLVVISDLYLLDTDIAEMTDPGIPVYWICTSVNIGFKPPFGRVLDLRS